MSRYKNYRYDIIGEININNKRLYVVRVGRKCSYYGRKRDYVDVWKLAS